MQPKLYFPPSADYNATAFKNEMVKKNAEFYKIQHEKLNTVYSDIQKHRDEQKSGLRKAKTAFKIPRIKRNKEQVEKIILNCLN